MKAVMPMPGRSRRCRHSAYAEAFRRSAVKLVQGGMNYAEAARTVGCSWFAVREWCIAAGVASKRRSRVEVIPGLAAEYEGGVGLDALAQRYRCSTTWVRNRLIKAGVSMRPRHRPRRLPDEVLGAVKALHGAGLSDGVISWALGMPSQTVASVRRSLWLRGGNPSKSSFNRRAHEGRGRWYARGGCERFKYPTKLENGMSPGSRQGPLRGGLMGRVTVRRTIREVRYDKDRPGKKPEPENKPVPETEPEEGSEPAEVRAGEPDQPEAPDA